MGTGAAGSWSSATAAASASSPRLSRNARTSGSGSAGPWRRAYARRARARPYAGSLPARSLRRAPTSARACNTRRVSVVPAEAARDQSFASVVTALAANVAITVAKGTAAALTGSPALLAETLHSAADAGNEVLLWVALRRSHRAPDATHPLGYGPERYYWALLAAVGMFVVGGTLSVWEGVSALIDPQPLEAFWAGVTVLIIAIVLVSVSRTVARRQLRRQSAERGRTLREFLRESSDPTVLTVYLEDSIDVLGAALALLALVLHHVTGSALPDALATIVIGLMLGYVAVRLTGRNRQLLSNQAIPDRYVTQLRDRLSATPEVAG